MPADKYANAGGGLLAAVAAELAEAQAALEEKLAAMVRADEALLSALDSQSRPFSRPLSVSMVVVDDPPAGQPGREERRAERVRVDKLVSRHRASLAVCEAELAALRKELAQADADVEAAARDMRGGAAASLAGAHAKDTLASFRASIEEELEAASAAATEEMRKSELVRCQNEWKPPSASASSEC